MLEAERSGAAREARPGLLVGLLYAAAALPALLAGDMPHPALLASIVLGSTLVALSVIDAAEMRLPDVLTLPLLAAGITFAVAAGWDSLGARCLAAVAGFSALYLPAAAYKAVRGHAGMGLGDAKLLAASAAWTGLDGIAAVIVYACAAALILALISRVAGRTVEATTAIPFGPFLAFATWLVWLYGPWTV